MFGIGEDKEISHFSIIGTFPDFFQKINKRKKSGLFFENVKKENKFVAVIKL